jgi:hypothetical protein
MTPRRFAPVLFACILLLAANAQARTLYVDGASAPCDGSSWDAPLKDVTEALRLAADGDEVWVTAGVYTPGTERTDSFQLKPGVSVYGGFKGGETERKRRDPEANQTILSGDIGLPGSPEDNVFHVVTGADRALIDGFTISGGYSLDARWHGPDRMTAKDATSSPGDGQGAGMLNFHTSPTVRGCVFQDNHGLMGGAVCNVGSDEPGGGPQIAPRFLGCAFWQNSALAWGGGAANLLARPLFVSCQFDSNLSEFKGGGMYNGPGAAPVLFNALFRNNEAPHGAGLADEGGSSAILYYCTLTGNRALTNGPAIHQAGGRNLAVLIKTVVWDNEAPEGDNRFFSEPPSAIRARAAVIQNGFDGQDVFRSNPGLDRRSETMLDNGYKTNGYKFADNLLPERHADMAKYGLTGDRPALDPAYALAAPAALLATKKEPVRTAAPEPAKMPTPAPTPEAVIAAIPEPPVAEKIVPAPTPATAEPAPVPVAALEPAPERIPAEIPAPEPEPVVPEPEPVPAPAPTPEPVPEPAPAPKAAPKPVAEPETKAEPEAVAMAVPLATTPPAAVVPPVAEPEMAEAAPEPTVGDKLSAQDLDGNGCLTLNETSGMVRQQFWRVDHNGDGCVSPAELERFEGRQDRPAKTAQPAMQAAATPRRSVPQAASAPRPTPPAAVLAALPKEQAAARPASVPAAPGAGYTLFAPVGGTKTFLTDGHGNTIKTWDGRDRVTGTAYLLPGGNLLRTVSPAKGEVRTPFEGSGVNGGIIQEVSPRGQIVWEYSYISKDVRQHHDIAPLPNGNVLILAWELKSGSQLDAAGASVRNHPDGRIWAEHIVEVRKSGPRSGQIVWQWHVWDHLVQNADPSAPGYASPVRLPQRMDVNYNPGRTPDWLHADAMDYNPALDQIVLSLGNTGEVWIIDHSTSTEQAASSSGGLMHRGGDILFRWGNPAAYGAAGQAELDNPHDARWVAHGKPGQETLLIANGKDRATGRANILEIQPQYYFKGTSLAARTVWSYAGGSHSGARRLPGGNTLVCDGQSGRVYEVTPQGATAWEQTASAKPLYRARRIPADHPGLARLGLP